MKGNQFAWVGLALLLVAFSARAQSAPAASGRPRILVCTDAGGSDFDDFQSLVHLFVYADRFDIEGIVSTPMGGTARKEAILKVIDVYKRDFKNLRTYSDHYPTPERLRSVTRQGRIEFEGLEGFGEPTEGSKWIIQCAEKSDPRPLWVLVWGGLEDLSQALHDDPSITPKLRVYFIGGPNKKWSARAYDYIAQHHQDLWMIECNSSYFGWFMGGNQQDDLSNTSFVAQHVKGQGALGDYFAGGISFGNKYHAEIKMGDTPSVVYVLGKTPEDPTKDSWGGRFVRAWDRHRYVFDHAPTQADVVETYSIIDIVYRPPTRSPEGTTASLIINKQEFPAFADREGAWHFVFCPKEPRKWDYTIHSSDPNLNGQTGRFTSELPSIGQPPAADYPNWWTDDPNPALAEGNQQGAKTVSRWRADYLRDFAQRMKRCAQPAAR